MIPSFSKEKGCCIKNFGVKNFYSIFFTAKAAMEKFLARQAFHGLVDYFLVTKKAAAKRIFFLRQPQKCAFVNHYEIYQYRVRVCPNPCPVSRPTPENTANCASSRKTCRNSVGSAETS